MIDLGVSLDGIDNIGPKVRAGVERFMLDGAQAGQNRAMEEVPEDRGNLRQSMAQFVPEVRDGDVVWGSTAKHTLPIEKGTDPFNPPVTPLLEWSRRVTGDEGLGWYVATVKIPEEGIDANPFLEPGAETQRKWYSSHDISSYIEDELE